MCMMWSAVGSHPLHGQTCGASAAVQCGEPSLHDYGTQQPFSTDFCSLLHEIVTKHLLFKKMCARWMPKQLTPEHKTQRIGSVLRFLEQYHDDSNEFLDWIVTDDETWVAHFTPETKQQSIHCRPEIHCSEKRLFSKLKRTKHELMIIIGQGFFKDTWEMFSDKFPDASRFFVQDLIKNDIGTTGSATNAKWNRTFCWDYCRAHGRYQQRIAVSCGVTARLNVKQVGLGLNPDWNKLPTWLRFFRNVPLNQLKQNCWGVNSIDEGCPVPDVAEGELPKCDSTYSIDIPNSVTLWEADPRPERSAEYYQFTLFAMSLNEMEDGMKNRLCPTDCRLRPDIRKLEEGDIDGAAAEKTRLEEKQRDARKARKGKKGLDWTPSGKKNDELLTISKFQRHNIAHAHLIKAVVHQDFDWRNVIFSDEVIVSNSNNSTALVYCMNGHRKDECFVRQINKSGCMRVTSWGWISYDGAGLLARIHGRFTAEAYKHILANVMIPSTQKRYPEGTLFFQQDNHPIHTANQIQRWFTRRRDVDPVDWPPNSPDMNPIQNLWAAVKRILCSNWAEQPPVRTPEELWDRVLDV
ncbi:hypothetical protein ANN_17712 [Periplaneta americana]|uniref:Tc1-like transposase DDE domain-containing protein n=1 Tax=Periplaneta americana TaxID=6978 RepID=A0ABQ8SV64_PERAM|nr:hypothetical protein ANN_17712 [Periplaneta americana]